MKRNTAKSVSVLALSASIMLTGCGVNSKKNDVQVDVTTNEYYSDSVDSYISNNTKTDEKTTNSNFEHCENENYLNQVAFCNDIMTMLKGENKDFEYFKSDEEAYSFYSEHLLESYYLYYLNRNVSINDIVTELNNLYVLSQTPSCVPDDYWNFMFAHLTKTMQGNSLYEEYIDLSIFIHDNSLEKDSKLVLKNKIES